MTCKQLSIHTDRVPKKASQMEGLVNRLMRLITKVTIWAIGPLILQVGLAGHNLEDLPQFSPSPALVYKKTEGVFPKGVFRRPAGFLNQGGQGLVLAYMRTFCKEAQADEC